MHNKLIERLRGSLSTLLYFFNTLFWFIPIFLLGIFKLLLPLKGWRTLCNALLDGCASCWIGSRSGWRHRPTDAPKTSLTTKAPNLGP